MKSTFTDKDFSQITSHGLTMDKVEAQIDNFRRGFGFLPVTRAATAGDGIFVCDDKNVDFFASAYKSAKDEMSIVKFVPASGAATRMFKDLFEYAADGKMTTGAEKVILNADKLAFYDIIKPAAINGNKAIADAILGYGAQLPKALILFHKYQDMHRTALDEHLAEGVMYSAMKDQVHIHFTISPEHRTGFEQRLAQTQGYFEKKYGIRYDISFSQQKSSTDTIAVTPENEPFREEDGSLLFRPAGHGALIENLNAIKADIIFIKTVDNVVPDRLKADTVRYKMALAGILISLQKKIFNYLHILDNGIDEATIGNISEFIVKELACKLPDDFEGMDKRHKCVLLKSILNRPFRVCGMVRNQGEPGGGPFWVKNSNGTESLQIGEGSQISPEQKQLLANGTHFNPVDIVCGIMDYKGRKFDLRQYVDPDTGFISEKSKNGRKLKAQELPGLWNGAMADWNTLFVEVPVSTFAPVKEIADLLRPEHQ